MADLPWMIVNRPKIPTILLTKPKTNPRKKRKMVKETPEVRRARRQWNQNYYLAVCGRWEMREIDDETYLCFGADSDCSFFNDSS